MARMGTELLAANGRNARKGKAWAGKGSLAFAKAWRGRLEKAA